MSCVTPTGGFRGHFVLPRFSSALSFLICLITFTSFFCLVLCHVFGFSSVFLFFHFSFFYILSCVLVLFVFLFFILAFCLIFFLFRLISFASFLSFVSFLVNFCFPLSSSFLLSFSPLSVFPLLFSSCLLLFHSYSPLLSVLFYLLACLISAPLFLS